MSDSPSRRVARFVRELRGDGFGIGPGETLDALRVIRANPVLDVARIRRRLRSLLCRDHAEWVRFPALFDRYWLPAAQHEESLSAAARLDPRLRRQARGVGTGLAGTTELGEDLRSTGAGAGRQATLSRIDYRFLTDARARREIERLAERLARSLRHRASRRRRIEVRGRRIHLRKTLRGSLRHAGLPVHPRYLTRKPQTPRLVLIQDISHSMAQYTPLLTRFCRGLLRAARDAEAFVFHIELHRITELYRSRDADEVKRRLDGMNRLWLGGTRIARSLSSVLCDHAERLSPSRTVVVMLSDGFDSDDADDLGDALARLRRRVRRIVWLSPALGREGISAQDLPEQARAHVDVLLPAHDLASLSWAVTCIGREPGARSW